MKLLLLAVLITLLNLSSADKLGVTSSTHSYSEDSFDIISKINNDEIHD